MTPARTKRIRLALVDHAYRLDGCGSSAAAEVHDLIAALPPDPGGEMPEPDAGMRVTLARGARVLVMGADPPAGVGLPWTISLPGGGFAYWTPKDVVEVRAPDRVLWRAP